MEIDESVETEVVLSIFDDEDNLVYEEIKVLNIPYSGSVKVEFDYIFDDGNLRVFAAKFTGGNPQVVFDHNANTNHALTIYCHTCPHYMCTCMHMEPNVSVFHFSSEQLHFT